MTSGPPSPDDGGSGEGGSRGSRPPTGIAPVRAAVVLIVFVVAAIALVGVGTRASVSGDAVVATTTTTTTAPSKTASTTTTTVPHSSVSVVVANATQTDNLAGHYTTELAAQGWAMQTARDASTTEESSAVYYVAGQQASAEAVATTLGIKPAAVQPFTAAVPVAGVSSIDVVVVIGADLVVQVST